MSNSPNPVNMKMSNNESDCLSCDPANTRRPPVPGLEGVKLVTEDSIEVGNQASMVVNVTGSKKFVQQAFHPSLFFTRPRSNSLGGNPSHSEKIQEGESLTQQHSYRTMNTTMCPPSWQRVPDSRNAKRKKISTPSPESIKTSNRFGDLPIDLTDDTSTTQTKEKKITKPPPIILYGIEDVNKLTDLVDSVAGKTQYSFKVVNRNHLRINCHEIETYKNVITKFREHEIIGHTFNRKDARPYRIVIKNLHHTTPLSEIKIEIEKTGNSVSGEIINAKYGPEKIATSTFFANLLPGPQNKLAKEIKYIYHQVVTIEDPRKRTTIPQCQRCQQYGHTKNYCMRPYRCVKCAQPHKTSDCPKKDRSTPAQCALCQGSHPANYKGCDVYKEILSRKSNKSQLKRGAIQKRSNNTEDISKQAEVPVVSLPTKPKNTSRNTQNTYARIARQESSTIPEQQNTNDGIPTHTHIILEQLIMKQNEKFDQILQQMSTLMSLITTLLQKLK